MALTTQTLQAATGTKAYTVLRSLCMDGQRVEVGATVQLTAHQGAELAHAGKVALAQDKPPKKKEAKA